MQIKLQPPSGSELPAFSPLVPPAVVSQVLLLANPHKVCAVMGSVMESAGRALGLSLQWVRCLYEKWGDAG